MSASGHSRNPLPPAPARRNLGPKRGRGSWIGVDVFQDVVMDSQGEIKAYHVGCLDRAEDWKPQPESIAYDLVHRCRVANPLIDNGECLTPQRMLETIADKAWYILVNVNGVFANASQDVIGRDRAPVGGPFGTNHFHQRDKVGRIPEVCADNTLAMLCLCRNLSD